jgi:hypothetical protein
MRVDDPKAEKVHHRAALFAIGQQLRAENSVDHPELMPDWLGSLVTELERDEEGSALAQVRAASDSGHGKAIGAAILHSRSRIRLQSIGPTELHPAIWVSFGGSRSWFWTCSKAILKAQPGTRR